MKPSNEPVLDLFSNKMQSELEQLQRNTILSSLPGLFLGIIALGVIMSTENEFTWPLTIALGLMGLILLVWLASRRSFLLASLVLVAGSLGAVLAVMALGRQPEAVVLLIFPVGLASLTLGTLAGAASALGCTLLLFLAPGAFQTLDLATKIYALLGIWGALGMIWMTLKPLLTVVDWSWQAYEQNLQQLDQAREYQVRLAQALQDLTYANTQLNRLNSLANSLRQAAEEERRVKEQFVANVSHELRTPLNMIIGFSEMILKEPQAYGVLSGQKIPTQLLADLQVVLRNSQHLSSLIDDVLDLSQIEAGQMAIKKEWVGVGEIVEAVSTAVRPLYKSKNLHLGIDATPDLPPIFCDRTRIREVLLNLLSNAGRFTETGGVTVRVWREGASIYFSVADTGPGISEEDQQKLFQPFQQLDGSIRRKHGGTGLGLSISKSFVELHDGRMWVESQKSQGTTFYFCLPIEPVVLKQSGFARWLSPQWTDKTPRLTRTPIVDARPHLLVVEKGKVLQRLLKRYLGEVAIDAVADLEAARTALEESPTCLVLVNDQQISETFEQALAFAPLPYNPLTIACAIPESTYYAPTPDISEILIKPIARDTLLGALDKLKGPVRTILLVEDEPDAQRLFLRVLASANRGYQVLRANTGIQALDILSRREVDAILLDLILPEMDGFQFLRIKAQDKRLKDLPVILISARDPQGHPIVSNFLAVTRGGGLSVQQLLAAIQALAGALVPNAPESALKQPGVLPG